MVRGESPAGVCWVAFGFPRARPDAHGRGAPGGRNQHSLVTSNRGCLPGLAALLAHVEVDDGADQGLLDVAGTLAQALGAPARPHSPAAVRPCCVEEQLGALGGFRRRRSSASAAGLQTQSSGPLQVPRGLGNLQLALHRRVNPAATRAGSVGTRRTTSCSSRRAQPLSRHAVVVDRSRAGDAVVPGRAACQIESPAGPSSADPRSRSGGHHLGGRFPKTGLVAVDLPHLRPAARAAAEAAGSSR